MPSLSEMLAEKKRKEAEALQKAEEAKKVELSALPGPEPSKRVSKKAIPVEVITSALPAAAIGAEQSSQDATGPVSSKEITMDTLRGLYWLATPEHIGDKKASRGQLKGRLNDLLLTKDGMRTLLKSLQEFVFS